MYTSLIKQIKEESSNHFYNREVKSIPKDKCIDFLEQSNIDITLNSYKDNKLWICYRIGNSNSDVNSVREERFFYTLDHMYFFKQITIPTDKYDSILNREDLNHFSCVTTLSALCSFEENDFRYDDDFISEVLSDDQLSDDDFQTLQDLFIFCYDKIKLALD
jgi:hypothetical protein